MIYFLHVLVERAWAEYERDRRFRQQLKRVVLPAAGPYR